MTQKDWLEVAIRVIGVYVLFWAVTNFAEAALMYTDYSRNPDLSFRYYLIYGWIDVIIGLLMVRAPGVLSNFAFPGEENGAETEAKNGEALDETNTD